MTNYTDPNTLPQVLPPDAEPWQRLLWEAADWLSDDNWCPGSTGCALAAMVKVWREWGETQESSFASGGAFMKAKGMLEANVRPQSIPRWSDSSDQGAAVSTMRACALRG